MIQETRAQGGNDGLIKKGQEENMFMWIRLMNEICTRQNKKEKKSKQNEQIIVHGTVESLDKQTANVSLITN